MNVLMISNSASFHQLASIMAPDSAINCIYHYGANPKNIPTDKYYPTYINIPDYSADTQVATVLTEMQHTKIDIILASGLSVPRTSLLRQYADSKNIPCIFPTANLTAIEADKMLTKKMLKNLDIPTSTGVASNGWLLFRDFLKYPKPFVIKIENRYMHGRQTIVVTDSNADEVFYRLFSKYVDRPLDPISINLDTKLIIENYIDIAYEISYHAILNKTSWAYLGSARDYKRQYDDDQGHLVDSMGSYYVSDVDSRIHEYVEKIHNYLREIKKPYTGIMFLGIAVGKDGIPYVLEINTRPGDPEIATIAASLNNFTEMIISTGKIPDAVENKKCAVSVSVNNTNADWNNIATRLPVISDSSHMLIGITGAIQFRSKHSLFTAIDTTRELAADKIYNFLKGKEMGQFYYRADIGYLK